MFAPTVVAYERGNRTVLLESYVGEKQPAVLHLLQFARMKMPRKTFVPQASIVEKVWYARMMEDDPDKLAVLASSVGGSFLYEAEEAFDNFMASLMGLVGQRVMDSIDESVLTVNMAGATKEQQEAIGKSLKKMLLESKQRAQKAVKENKPFLERIRHILPVWNEKQIINWDAGSHSAAKRSGNYSMDDVMFHARVLAGVFGTDLGLIGFADQMPASLGESGTFRASATVAERARIIRASLSDFIECIIDLHTYHKYNGLVFEPGDRPWIVNYFGNISALENERQVTKTNAMNGGLLLGQAMQTVKELGFKREQMEHFLSKQLLLDEDDAKMYAPVVDVPFEPGPGGMGGPALGGEPGDPFGDPKPDPKPPGGGEDDA